MDITPDVNVEELVEAYPKAVGFLADRGIVCIRCGEPYWGSLRDLARTRNLDGQIEAIATDLRDYLAENAPAQS